MSEKNVTIEMVKEAAKNNDIDKLIDYAKDITEIDKSIEIYESYLEKELEISKFIFKTIQSVKNRRERNKLGEKGFFVCRFD